MNDEQIWGLQSSFVMERIPLKSSETLCHELDTYVITPRHRLRSSCLISKQVFATDRARLELMKD
jgi:hypothetical protein